jgi:hypothetical protein
VVEAQRSGPFAQLASGLFFLLQLFFPDLETDERKILERDPARKKKGLGPGSITYLLLSTGRCMNFRETNHEPTPYSDAHTCALAT